MAKQNKVSLFYTIIIGFIVLSCTTVLMIETNIINLKKENLYSDNKFVLNYQDEEFKIDDTHREPVEIAHIKIPTYNQKVVGYVLGCEGVSLYMALRGLGYASEYNIDQFMDTMPKGNTPFEGYMGNPKIGHYGENNNKRTTIYPEPLAKWARDYADANDLTGASVEKLKEELSEGHVVLAFVTGGWTSPIWKKYSWSTNEQGEVENNHCLAVVGYRSNGDFLVNDCHDGRVDGRQGEYWISGETFERIYNARKYAISVY